MKKILLGFLVMGLSISCKETVKNSSELKVSKVAEIRGQQLTGVTINKERIFVNFPRWRENVKQSVSEVKGDEFVAYPNASWNNWELGQSTNDSTFVAVQSVVASQDKLFVIDTRNPNFQGVLEQPIIFVFDLNTNQLDRTYKLPKTVFHKNSYINDVRIDTKRNYAYFTDSGNPGLVLLNLTNGEAKRVLDHHISTTSEVDYLTINNKQWKNKVHADGIAFDDQNDMLYYHALTGYNLYAISVEKLIKGTKHEIENSVIKVAKTASPDGMIINNGVLYYADLENHKIMQMDLKTKKKAVLLEGDQVKWADSFAIENGYLYYTNSRIHESAGDISDLKYSVYKIKL